MSVLIMLILTSYSCAAYTPPAILYFCNLFSKTNIRWFRRLFFRFSLTVTSQTYILPLDATFSNCFCINFQTWRESSKHFPVNEKISRKSLKLRLHALRLIGPILYPGECDLMVHPRKHIVIFSRMHFATFVRVYTYNMHQDTKSALLITVSRRTFTKIHQEKYL